LIQQKILQRECNNLAVPNQVKDANFNLRKPTLRSMGNDFWSIEALGSATMLSSIARMEDQRWSRYVYV